MWLPLIFLFSLLYASIALAGQWHVAPTGTGDCLDETPCNLPAALKRSAKLWGRKKAEGKRLRLPI